jgi:hypothetical protein
MSFGLWKWKKAPDRVVKGSVGSVFRSFTFFWCLFGEHCDLRSFEWDLVEMYTERCKNEILISCLNCLTQEIYVALCIFNISN